MQRLIWFLTGALAFGQSPPVRLKQLAPEWKAGSWLNAPPSGISLESRRGQVTVVHFWTYGCINCKRNLPIYARWHERFQAEGIAVIGVHSPEFEHEAKPENVARRVRELGIAWPVLLDPRLENWRRWNQQYWPSVYLVDKKGQVRYRWDGEMNYGSLDGERKMTALIEQLLLE